ncbi:MAG: cyclic nucleotide-binding domain-containing protein [Firmicutes bacterium]|nr:cyclic nucleotide-binding domain-containing protein [Bacillota bacterium]
MKRIYDEKLLNNYIEMFRIYNYLDGDIYEDMNLFKYEKGEVIYKENDKINYFYFLVKGRLKIYTLQENGKKLLLRFNKPLAILGDLEYLNNYTIKTNVESLDSSLLIGIDINVLREKTKDNIKFYRFIIKNLSHKLYTISNSSSINLLYPVKNRFASYLVSVLDGTKKEIMTSNYIELANLLGTSYRQLNRVINDLTKKGIIIKENKEIKIIDYNKLKTLSKGLYK